jgi:hypothetical protein
MNRLCILFPLNVTAIRDRLKPLLELGAFLPLAGMSRARRSKFKALRPVLAVECYLNGENLTEIRRSLCLSRFQWREWYQGFRRALKLKDRPVAEITQAISQPVEVVEGWLQLAKNLTPDAQAQKILAEDAFWPWETRDAFTTSHGFRQLLQERHGFSPAAAEDFCLFLRDLARQFSAGPRSGGQIIYIGVASTEGPGRSLNDSRLEAVRLDYLAPQDWAIARRTTTRALKWARIERFATQAYAQGAALSLPDIAYLVSVSVDAVRDAIARHPTVVLPTRGHVADMGSTLSHAEKIIDLFMYGYTETEITRRTGHSYESIERYLLDFARVVYLAEAGMPIPAIQQVTGFSKRLVDKCNTLYQKYNTPTLPLPWVKSVGLPRPIHQPDQNQRKGKVMERMRTGIFTWLSGPKADIGPRKWPPGQPFAAGSTGRARAVF